MKSEDVIKELDKVIDDLGEISFLPKDIAAIANVDGEIIRIKYEDLHKYKYKKGKFKLK